MIATSGMHMDGKMDDIATNPFEGLSQKHISAINALTATKGLGRAAKRAGVSRQTLRLYLREPSFRKALRESQQEQFESLSIALLALADKATTAFDEIFDAPSAPGSAVKRAAASDVIGHAMRLRELIGLEDRIAILEERWAK